MVEKNPVYQRLRGGSPQQYTKCISGMDLFRQLYVCLTEVEVADQAFYLTQSLCTDAGQTSLSADSIALPPGRVATGVPVFKLSWKKIHSDSGN